MEAVAQDTDIEWIAPPDDATKRPILKPENRTKYMAALTELVGTLPVDTFEKVYVGDFCLRHDIKPSFFDALRDLDCLELNLLATEANLYRKTPKLYQVTPEQVSVRMRSSGRKTIRQQGEDAEQEESPEAEPLPTTPAPLPGAVAEWQRRLQAEKDRRKQVKEAPKETETPIEVMEKLISKPPVKTELPDPYVIRIESKKMDLRLDVQTRHDVAIITAIMGQLNA